MSDDVSHLQAVFGEVEGIPEDAARKEFDVLFWGPVYISKLVSPFPLLSCADIDQWKPVSTSQTAKTVREVNEKGQGAVIFNVSSAGGFSGNPGLAFYSAAKFGVFINIQV